MEIMDLIDHGSRQLDDIGRRLATAIRELAVVERDYFHAMEQAKLELLHEYKERGERLPAEDLRTALAHRRIDSKLYGAFLQARAEVDALKAYARVIESGLSGRQSLLGAMKAEMVGAP